MVKLSLGIAIGTAAFGLLFYWLRKHKRAKQPTDKGENAMAEYGIQVFDENGRLQATLTEREMSIVHYTLYYPKGSGRPRDMRFLSARVREYPGYKATGSTNISAPDTITWDGGSNGFEVQPQQSVVMGEEWYAMSAVADASSNPLIRAWTMPGSTCLYDRSSNKFICRAENRYISGLLITVGSK